MRRYFRPGLTLSDNLDQTRIVPKRITPPPIAYDDETALASRVQRAVGVSDDVCSLRRELEGVVRRSCCCGQGGRVGVGFQNEELDSCPSNVVLALPT